MRKKPGLIWWYATAYAIFLALLPFLAKGLKALGRECHLSLAATVLVIWGLTSFIPGMVRINDGFLGLIYLFILISAYKWYMKPFTTRQVGAADVFLETGRKDYHMSGPEERQRAVDLYSATPMTTAQVVEHLAYPTRQCLERWPAADSRYAGHMAKPIILMFLFNCLLRF